MTRMTFLGALLGAPFARSAGIAARSAGIARRPKNTFLSSSEASRIVLEKLSRDISFHRDAFAFRSNRYKIGHTITVRRPARFVPDGTHLGAGILEKGT